MSADAQDPGRGETLPVALAEARAVAPATVSSIEAVARSRLLVVGFGALLSEVAALLSGSQISLVLVCDDEGRVAGVITETILVKELGLGHAGIFTTCASAVMSRDFTVCAPGDTLSDVLAMMHERGIIHVAITDEQDRPLGVLNVRDGLRALLAAGNQEEALLRDYVMGVGYQ
jgi:CBS domain-containing protein